MLHMTIESYHRDDVWDLDEEHPDGTLWLLTKDEVIDLPEGIVMECAIDNTFVSKGSDLLNLDFGCKIGDNVYTMYGIRGRREPR